MSGLFLPLHAAIYGLRSWPAYIYAVYDVSIHGRHYLYSPLYFQYIEAAMTKQNSITLILVKMLTYEQIIKAEPPIHRVLDDEAKIFVSGHLLPLQASTMTNQKFCFVITVTIYGLRSWPAYIYAVYYWSLYMENITFTLCLDFSCLYMQPR